MEETTEKKADYTIGIPFYNDFKNLNVLLTSIEEQIVDFNFNVLILDDCSPKPLKLKKNYSLNISISRNSKNLGPGGTRQKIMESVSTDYLLFLDSDSLFPDKESLKKLYDARKLATITFPQVRDELEKIHPWTDYGDKPTMMVCVQLELQRIKDSKVKFRHVFDFFCEDMCFFFECAERQLDFHYCSDILVKHSRATTAQCPIRLTEKKHINLMYGYFALRFLFPNKLKSDWCDYNYVKNVFRRNFFIAQKDEEYVRILKALGIFFLRFPMLAWLKYVSKI